AGAGARASLINGPDCAFQPSGPIFKTAQWRFTSSPKLQPPPLSIAITISAQPSSDEPNAKEFHPKL
ncbi:hypothetical protein CCACVL1_17610, partial [Corchorus capsularis]